MKCVLEDVFEVPVKPEVEIPQEWLDQVSIQTYTPQTTKWNNQPVTNFRGGRGHAAGPDIDYSQPVGQQSNASKHAMGNGGHKQGSKRERRYDMSMKNREHLLPKAKSLWEESVSEENMNRVFSATEGGILIPRDDVNSPMGLDPQSGNVVELDSRRSLPATNQHFAHLEAEEADQTTTSGTAAEGEAGTDEIQSQASLDSPGEYDYYAAEYGEAVASAKEDLDAAIADIGECDEALLDTISQCYKFLSSKSKITLGIEGFDKFWNIQSISPWYFQRHYGDLVSLAKADVDKFVKEINDCEEGMEDTVRQCLALLSKEKKDELYKAGLI